jgi:hypothetical protein
MDVRWIGFGEIEIDGRRYAHDVVIDRGHVTKRKKGPSKPHREAFGHTPLSTAEAIPWASPRLIVGTGASGLLPIMIEVRTEAERRGVELIVVPTERACALLRETTADTSVSAVLHVTC